MPVTTVKKPETNKRKNAVVSKKVKDYSNDPFIVKKAKAAESFLKKHGVPPAFGR